MVRGPCSPDCARAHSLSDAIARGRPLPRNHGPVGVGTVGSGRRAPRSARRGPRARVCRDAGGPGVRAPGPGRGPGLARDGRGDAAGTEEERGEGDQGGHEGQEQGRFRQGRGSGTGPGRAGRGRPCPVPAPCESPAATAPRPRQVRARHDRRLPPRPHARGSPGPCFVEVSRGLHGRSGSESSPSHELGRGHVN